MKKSRHCENWQRNAVAVAVASCFVITSPVYANPIGADVVSGVVSMAQQGNALNITNSPGAIINWQGFSIGANEATRFIQQSAASSVLNRVVGQDPSSILGALQSNGRVFLINPNGVLFGAGAQVDVAGLIVSTLNLSNADFLNGRYNFTANANAGGIDNQGSLTALPGGQIYLVAPKISNSGLITSPQGDVILAAGNSVELVNASSPDMRVVIDAPDNQAVNLGSIVANSGRIGIYAGLINHHGIVSADSATQQGGKIVFKAVQRTEISGTTSANGISGGTIQILGNQVGVIDGAAISADGTQDGGTVLVGGDYQGKNPDVSNAQTAYVASTASISADATQNGNGGKIIIWADDATRAYGQFSARGGANGGNGGFIETSGKNFLAVDGIRVDTRAADGGAGTWLLDPTDITISHSTSAVNAGLTVAGNTSTISDFDINTALSTTNVTISTASAGTVMGDIKFDASGGAVTISNLSTGARILQLNAENDIKFLGGATTFASPSSTSVLDVGFNPAGKITTAAGSSVTLDGNLGLTRAWVALAKTWENSGTLSLTNNAALHIEHNYGAGASTFHNIGGGIVNVASTQGWAIWSNACCQNGILINDGAINVTSSTAFEAAYSQSASGTLNIADTKFLNLQNAIALSGGVNLNATGALNINENHGTAATLSNLTFSGTGGTLLVTGSKTANLTNVSAPNVALTVGGGGTINIINGDAVFKTLSLSGGTFGAMTNGTFGITSGDFIIPTGVIYSGNIGYLAAGNLTLASPFATTTGTLSLTAGNNLNINANIGSSGARFNHDLTLTAGNNVNINSSIYMGNNTLTLAADADANGVGNTVIRPPVLWDGSLYYAVPVTVNTQGAINVSGAGMQVLGYNLGPWTCGWWCSYPQVDAAVTVNAAGGFNATLTGDMMIKAGYTNTTIDRSVSLNAAGDINITAASLTVQGGNAFYNTSDNSGSYVARADAVLRGANVGLTLGSGGLLVRGGDATARESYACCNSNSPFLNVTASANAELSATGNLTISSLGGVEVRGGDNADAWASSNSAGSPGSAIANADALLSAGNLLTISNAASLTVKGGYGAVARALNGGENVATATADATVQAGSMTINLSGALTVQGGSDAFASASGSGISTATATANAKVHAATINIAAGGAVQVRGGYSPSCDCWGPGADANGSNASASALANAELSATGGLTIDSVGSVTVVGGGFGVASGAWDYGAVATAFGSGAAQATMQNDALLSAGATLTIANAAGLTVAGGDKTYATASGSGSNTAMASTKATVQAGSMDFTLAGPLTVQGGSTVATTAGSGILLSTATASAWIRTNTGVGGIIATVAGDVALTGGNAAGTEAKIFSYGPIDLTIGGSTGLSLTGTSGAATGIFPSYNQTDSPITISFTGGGSVQPFIATAGADAWIQSLYVVPPPVSAPPEEVQPIINTVLDSILEITEEVSPLLLAALEPAGEEEDPLEKKPTYTCQ